MSSLSVLKMAPKATFKYGLYCYKILKYPAVKIVFSCLWIRKRGIRMTTTIKFQFYFVIGFTCYAYRNVVIWYSQKGKKLFEEAPIIYFQLKELRFFQSTFTFSISNKANSKFSVMDLWISLYNNINFEYPLCFNQKKHEYKRR